MEENKKVFRSLILKYFPKELLIRLDALSDTHSVSNNRKVIEVNKFLNEFNVPYSPLANGTNRYGILIDGYVFKIALDRDGKIDNQREFKYAKPLYPYVIKTFESNTLINICEYVTIFSMDDFHSNQDEMRKILSKLSETYLIGDIGINPKNYVNWGTRLSGEICILDYAYIYALSYKVFECKNCDNKALLEFDRDFVNLCCPYCKAKYSFSEIRRRVSKQDQTIEIGDIYSQGYLLHSLEEEKPINYKFSPEDKPKEKKIKESYYHKKKEEIKKENEFTNDYQMNKLEELNKILFN